MIARWQPETRRALALNEIFTTYLKLELVRARIVQSDDAAKRLNQAVEKQKAR